MKTNKVTDYKIKKVYEFLKNFMEKNGYPPTVREIAQHNSIKSTASVYYYLEKLEDIGWIKRAPSKNRAIEIMEINSFGKVKGESVDVAYVGEIPAGQPKSALELYDDIYSFPKGLFNAQGDLIMLDVVGESMIEAGIYNGDKVIIRKQSYADNGQIVAALIDNESATIKRFYKEKDFIRLKPENSTMDDIIVKEVYILGVLVGLVRRY